MSLFKGSLRPPAVLSDEAIERYLAAIRAEIEIDPLFRRRLRGQVVNRYVAAREGPAAGKRQRHMGRLGRAVLYASFSLAVSVTSVLAASRDALPGELLYPLKRHVEELRVQILPNRFQPELAAYALSERISEMDRLADAGDWHGVARLATTVEAGYADLVAMDPAGADVALHQHFVVLHGLLDRLPEGARSAIQSTLERTTDPDAGSTPWSDTGSGLGTGGGSGGTNSDGTNPNGSTNNGGTNSDGTNPNGSTNNGGGDSTDAVDESSTPKPTKSPRPTRSPKPSG